MDYVENQSTTTTTQPSDHQLLINKNNKYNDIMVEQDEKIDYIKSQLRLTKFTTSPVENLLPNITYSLFFQALDISIEDKILGKGHYSKANIYAGKYRKSGRSLAIKVISFKEAPENIYKHIAEEINAVKDIRHSNLIRTHEYYLMNHQAFIVMDNVGSVDLHTTLKTMSSTDVEEKIFWLCEVLFGIGYLHKLSVCHRDIKPDNIMIKKDKYGVKHAIIVDFGFSIKLKKPNELVKVYCGTRSYKSPEIRRGIPYNPFYSDMWSYGVLFLRVLTGKVIFHDLKTSEICDLIKNRFENITRMADGKRMKLNTAIVLKDTLIEEPHKRILARKLLTYDIFITTPACKSLYKLNENIDIFKAN